MDDRTLLKTSIVATVITAICCFTPILAVTLGLVGLSVWIGWVDYVLMPALVVFIALTVFAIVRSRKRAHEHNRRTRPRMEA